MTRAGLVALVVLAVAAAGCGGGGASTSSTASGRVLTDLNDVGTLHNAFNSASGEPRLIMLLSPT